MSATTKTGGTGRYWLPQLLRIEVDGRDWRHRGACLGVDPEVFYPLDTSPGSRAAALALDICAGCPVRTICLADTLAGEDPARRWGVLGGTTPEQRSTLFVAARTAPAGEVA